MAFLLIYHIDYRNETCFCNFKRTIKRRLHNIWTIKIALPLSLELNACVYSRTYLHSLLTWILIDQQYKQQIRTGVLNLRPLMIWKSEESFFNETSTNESTQQLSSALIHDHI